MLHLVKRGVIGTLLSLCFVVGIAREGLRRGSSLLKGHVPLKGQLVVLFLLQPLAVDDGWAVKAAALLDVRVVLFLRLLRVDIALLSTCLAAVQNLVGRAALMCGQDVLLRSLAGQGRDGVVPLRRRMEIGPRLLGLGILCGLCALLDFRLLFLARFRRERATGKLSCAVERSLCL